jgi:hypothetical protein
LLGVECSFRRKTPQFLPNEKTEKKNEKKKKTWTIMWLEN